MKVPTVGTKQWSLRTCTWAVDTSCVESLIFLSVSCAIQGAETAKDICIKCYHWYIICLYIWRYIFCKYIYIYTCICKGNITIISYVQCHYSMVSSTCDQVWSGNIDTKIPETHDPSVLCEAPLSKVRKSHIPFSLSLWQQSMPA